MSVPISFTVTVKNNVQGTILQTLSVQTQSGNNLHQALTAYASTIPSFQFQAKDDPRSGTYLVSVLGISSAPDKFWTIALYNPSSKDVKPIGLSYEINSGDNIGLLFINY